MKPLLVYLFLINALALLLMLADKHNAKNKLWRIPERSLLGIAVLGGSLGCLMGMYAARHKTKRPKFYRGVPILLAVHILLMLIFFWNIK